ncbi:putative bifunctional diguanylate cyclase/phosphodiesterase [Shewanella sp. 10N.261.52.F9]|uniref:putative bifunctional diguanylate cyclase/phosphodiesterase n=1 Tax=Shewanella sp. 10N.261.52.F9 TaxID=3229684 RepID=UPI00354C6BBF
MIFGLFTPLVIAACLVGNDWLHDEVEDIRHYVIERELASIESQLDQDLAGLQGQFEATAPVKGGLVALMPSIAIFGSAQVQPSLEGTILPIDKLAQIGLNLPEPLLSSARASVYFDAKQQQAYFININLKTIDTQPETLVLVTPITDDYLAHIGSLEFATQVKVITGKAKAGIVLSDNVINAQLDVPTLFSQAPIYLSVTFSDQLFSRIGWHFSLVVLALFAVMMGLLSLAYMWIRLAVAKPLQGFFSQLSAMESQVEERSCNKLDVKNLALVSQAGSSGSLNSQDMGVKLLTDNINQLLASNYNQHRQSKMILESIAEAVIMIDLNGNVSDINPYAERLLQQNLQQAQGQPIHELLRSSKALTAKVSQFMQIGCVTPKATTLKLNLDTSIVMTGTLTNLLNAKGEVIAALLVLKDITRENSLNQQVERHNHFDWITGVLNRTAFETQLVDYVSASQSIAVVYFDLEQFKLINDACGHSVGDKMLAKVAKAISASIPSGSLLGRLGGDEFALVVKDLSALDTVRLVKAVISKVSAQSILNKGICYRVGLSAGVALSQANQKIEVFELLKDADIACDAAKRKGNNQVHLYDSRDKDLSYQRNAPKWAVRIVEAIENNELILYYQKIAKLSSHGYRQRMELLLRIQDPSGRLLSPAQFIAAAERFKLIVEVDKEVIRKAFLWLSLNQQVWEDHCLSINLSGNSLGAEGMVNYILRQQERFAIPSCCICFEITETSAIQNHSRAMKMLTTLRKRGFSFALDDFGSGFASYGYLKEMPVDYVKIDGCFVKNIANNAKDYAIVKSVNDVCRVMGIETVAEFVENQEIIDKLEIIGVNYAQGYAIGRPQALDTYKVEPRNTQRTA